MSEYIFKDTVVNNPNKKRITILSQSGNDLIAEINYAEPVQEQGTVLNAQMLIDFQDSINNSSAASTNAVETANQAQKDVETLKEAANNAATTADNAAKVADEAKQTAQKALTHVTETVGTVVNVGGSMVNTFDADTKVNLAQGTENANKVLVAGQDGNVAPSNTIPLGNGVYITSQLNEETGEVSVVLNFPEET